MPASSCFRVLAFAALMLVAVVAGAGPAAAGDGPGTKVVRGANDTIAKLLKQKVKAGSDAERQAAAKVIERARGFLDIDELARRALVDHWPKLTEAQRTEYLGLLRGLIEDNYVKGLRANLDYKVAYTAEGPGRDGAILVSTTITAKKRGRPVTIAIDYLLLEAGGKLRCFDVKTDGVGLVENYRAQFNKIIAKDGFDGLITRMKKKRATAQ